MGLIFRPRELCINAVASAVDRLISKFFGQLCFLPREFHRGKAQNTFRSIFPSTFFDLFRTVSDPKPALHGSTDWIPNRLIRASFKNGNHTLLCICTQNGHNIYILVRFHSPSAGIATSCAKAPPQLRLRRPEASVVDGNGPFDSGPYGLHNPGFEDQAGADLC